MKKQILFLTIAATAFLASCSVSKTNTAKTTDIYGAGVIQKPVLVDLDVKVTKVTGTATGTASKVVSLESVKLDAVVDAIKKSGADVLVEPTFETLIAGGQITATVTGFPATYKNFRPITPEDVPLLQVGVTQKANVYEAPKNQKKRGGCF